MLRDVIEEIEKQQERLKREIEDAMNDMDTFQENLPLVLDADFEVLKQRQKNKMKEFQKVLTNLIDKATR